MSNFVIAKTLKNTIRNHNSLYSTPLKHLPLGCQKMARYCFQRIINKKNNPPI